MTTCGASPGQPSPGGVSPGYTLRDHASGTDAWIDALIAASRDRYPAVVVTVASVRGSTPREPGARMVVSADRIAGTIGGGNLEHQAIGIARHLLAAGGGVDLRRFSLGASLGQCCGGVATLFFDPVAPGASWVGAVAARHRAGTPCVVVTPSRGDTQEHRLVVDAAQVEGSLGGVEQDATATAIARRMLATGAPTALASREGQEGFLFDVVHPPALQVVLFGAGHVGLALVRTLAGLPCRITWVDTRYGVFPDTVPANVKCVGTSKPEAEVAAAPPGAYFLVMTHSHPLDQALCEMILGRDDFAYFGLIGSVSKRRQFERRMRLVGVDPRRFERMTCPIGVAGIASKEPAAIAIAVAAEVLRIHERSVHAGRAGEQVSASASASASALVSESGSGSREDPRRWP